VEQQHAGQEVVLRLLGTRVREREGAQAVDADDIRVATLLRPPGTASGEREADRDGGKRANARRRRPVCPRPGSGRPVQDQFPGAATAEKDSTE
jgi:hypothetical protein